MTVKQKVGLLIPWIILIVSGCFGIFCTGKGIILLYFFCGSYLISLGSIVYVKLPNFQSSKYFYLFTSCLGIMLLFIYLDNLFLSMTGLFLLCICPILLYMFLYSFIVSSNIRILKKTLLILSCISIYCCFTFFFNFHPEASLLLLLLGSVGSCALTISRERKLFFSTSKFKILSLSIPLSFIPFILVYFAPLIAFKISTVVENLSILAVIVFPTCIAYTLVTEKLIKLPKNFIFCFCILLSTSLLFLVSSFLSIDLWKRIVLLLLFTIFSVISYIITIFLESAKDINLKKEIKELSNEKVELINQVSYSQFLNSLAELVLNRLHDLTSSPTILVLVNSTANDTFTLCQQGENILYKAKKSINFQKKEEQILKLQNIEYGCLPIIINSNQTIWVIINMSSKKIDRQKIEKVMQSYGTMLDTAKLLYNNQKKFTDIPLHSCQLLQIKLFSSLENEKMRFTNYLHDDILQTIVGIHTLVTNLQGDPEVRDLVEIEFEKLVYSIRKEIFDTSPSTLYYLPFEDNLNILIENFNQKYANTHFTLITDMNFSLAKHIVSPIYRIIKELNENIGKHAKASFGKTTINLVKNTIEIIVEDNGVGIGDYSELETNLEKMQGHIGLLSIKNDVSWLSGVFELLPSTTNTGTRIKVSIPYLEEVRNEDTIG